MMQRTDSVERTAAAPDLLHLARQRDRVGPVIPAGQREHTNTHIHMRVMRRTNIPRGVARGKIMYTCIPRDRACALGGLVAKLSRTVISIVMVRVCLEKGRTVITMLHG